MTGTILEPQLLGPAEMAVARPFVNPAHVAADHAVLSMLVRGFADHVAQAASDAPIVRYLPTRDSWQRRVVIPHPAALAQRDTITVVGFFGRPSASLVRSSSTLIKLC